MDKLPQHATNDEIDRTLEQGFKAWDELPMESRRAIIKGGYRVELLAGGRGPDRDKSHPEVAFRRQLEFRAFGFVSCCPETNVFETQKDLPQTP
jgi:hypothetical protein